jgi:cytidylate kinase
MPLVAMTREMGSMGMDVARIVESELRVPLVYHEIIDHLADKMRLRKSHVVRLLGGKANLFERLTADKTSLSIFTADEVLQTASKGAVLRGWGAAHLLRPVKHAICVRVCAPMAVRVKRMMERLDTDDREAVETEIRHNDEAQGAIVRRHFGVDWQHPEFYDVALNTERMSVEQCAEKVIRLARDARFAETEESRAELDDLVLVAKVRAALRQDAATRELSVSMRARRGAVTLEGVVDAAAQAKDTERVAAAVPGVRSVENLLRAVSEMRKPMRE